MGTNCTLRDIFKHGFEAYRRTGKLLPFQIKAGLAILRCRTAELGGHVKRCPTGCVEKAWYNSCRHRACPLCAWTKIHQWLEKIRARLLPTDHYHVTFTLPGELRVFWDFDRRAISDLMFKIARTTLFNALADPEHLGAKPGILMSLHTWARDLWSHVHTFIVWSRVAASLPMAAGSRVKATSWFRRTSSDTGSVSVSPKPSDE